MIHRTRQVAPCHRSSGPDDSKRVSPGAASRLVQPFILSGLTVVISTRTRKHTDRPRYSVGSNRTHLCLPCVRCGLTITVNVSARNELRYFLCFIFRLIDVLQTVSGLFYLTDIHFFVTITSNAKIARIPAILFTTYFTRNYSHCPEQGLCNGRVSVNPSVCPIDRPQQRRVCCLCGQEISIESGGRRAPQHGAQQQMWSVSY